jgi:hypothetical protein
MKERIPLTGECVERLHVWVQTHCPCMLDEPDSDFMPGLFVIVEEEVREALLRERKHIIHGLFNPCQQ